MNVVYFAPLALLGFGPIPPQDCECEASVTPILWLSSTFSG